MDLQEMALAIIGEVDYDIEKECQMNIEETGSDMMVDGVVYQLEMIIAEAKREVE